MAGATVGVGESRVGGPMCIPHLKVTGSLLCVILVTLASRGSLLGMQSPGPTCRVRICAQGTLMRHPQLSGPDETREARLGAALRWVLRAQAGMTCVCCLVGRREEGPRLACCQETCFLPAHAHGKVCRETGRCQWCLYGGRGLDVLGVLCTCALSFKQGAERPPPKRGWVLPWLLAPESGRERSVWLFVLGWWSAGESMRPA